MSSERFKEQNYEKIRKHRQELGVPWTDPTFPANEASIGTNKAKELPRNIEWKRPGDLCESPHLFVDGASIRDATQGRLGNCWFVAACAVLARSKPLWEKVIPDWKDQEWGESENYSGVFRFRFWVFGRWVEVLVDDLLPTSKGELLFAHSTDNSEFWAALVEKAYAKLHGNYEALDGGILSDALVDFTSGISETIKLEEGEFLAHDDKKKELFQTLTTEIEDHTLMCCATKADNPSELGGRTDVGLVRGHAYGITAVRKVPVGGTSLVSLFKGREKLYLVRLQNPWGEKEWSGPFSDKSEEWTNISDKEKEKLGLTFNDDGEFWMPFDDFLQHFNSLYVCRIINTSIFSFSKTWHGAHVYGSWAAPDRAGGCIHATFLNNPQYRFDVDKNEGDDFIIQLSQRANSGSSSALPTIGFRVMKVETNRKYRVHTAMETAASSDYLPTRHIFLRKKFSPGRYVIVPTTLEKGVQGDFLLRIFADDNFGFNELTKDRPEAAWWQICGIVEPSLLTRVVVKSAEGLEDTFGKSDPYCIISCEGKQVKSDVIYDTQSPSWSSASAIFYRKTPDKVIKVKVYNRNRLMRDGFLGQACIQAAKAEGRATHSCDLFGKGRHQAEKKKGRLTVEVDTYADLTAL